MINCYKTAIVLTNIRQSLLNWTNKIYNTELDAGKKFLEKNNHFFYLIFLKSFNFK